jgi:hypothetical protein
MLFFRCFCHVGCERANQSVTKQDAKKSAHQSGSDFLSDLLRGAAKSAHGDHDAEYGSYNA